MDKKTKKKAIRARNKRIQVTQYHIDQHRDATAIAALQQQDMAEEQLEASRLAEKAASDAEEPWTARTQMIRNRMTNKKRKSMDRWNRFAGTAGAGGRGL